MKLKCNLKKGDIISVWGQIGEDDSKGEFVFRRCGSWTKVNGRPSINPLRGVGGYGLYLTSVLETYSIDTTNINAMFVNNHVEIIRKLRKGDIIYLSSKRVYLKRNIQNVRYIYTKYLKMIINHNYFQHDVIKNIKNH